MYRVQHHAYCGMSSVPACFDTEPEARSYVAGKLKRTRSYLRVTTLETGKEWEILEPEGCATVPDACGTLSLAHITYACRECGCEHETPHDALHCCADCGED